MRASGLIIFLLLSVQLVGQGIVSGSVNDSLSGNTMEFATVSLYAAGTDSLITGGITDLQGQFKLEGVPFGNYDLKADFIGYHATTISGIKISAAEPVYHAGSVIVAPTAHALDGVVVEDEIPFVQIELDKKVFNVDQNLNTAGGTGTDVMEQIPSVEVDMDGNISLRGTGNVTILIDGKPSSLTGGDRGAVLDAIPADAIERVEVITNPSAKYDPDGMAGIINIILKKNKLVGFHGSVNASVGTGEDFGTLNKWSGSANLNFRNEHFNLFGNYSFRDNLSYTQSELYRRTNYNDTLEYLEQDGFGTRDRVSHTFKGGIDIYLNDLSSLTLSTTQSVSDNGRDETNSNEELNDIYFPTAYYFRISDEEESERNQEYNAYYTKNFEREGMNLIGEVNYSMGTESESNDAVNDVFFGTPIVDEDNRTVENQSRTVLTARFDFTHPLNDTARLEFGAKSIVRNIDTDFEFYGLVGELATYDSSRSNHFVYDEQIHAVYATYGNQLGVFGFQAGLRLEQALTKSTLVTTGEEFENNYFSVFPTLHLSYDFGNENVTQLSYSRRIDRPSIRSLNPFTDYSNPLSLRIGNPFLLPEYTNSIEWAYIKTVNRNTFTGSIYFRNTNDEMTRIRTIDTTGVSTLTFANLSRSASYGVELISVVNVKKWLKLNWSFNFYHNIYDGTNLGSEFDNNGYSWNTRMTAMWIPTENSTVQLTGNYRAPSPHTQGDMQPIYSMDLSYKLSFLDGKASLTAQLKDVFNTNRFAYDSTGEGYYQEGLWDRESQILTITFNYRFGRLDFEKKERGGGDWGGGDGGMDGF